MNQNWHSSYHREDADNQSYNLWYHTLVRLAIAYGFNRIRNSDEDWQDLLVTLARKARKQEILQDESIAWERL